MNEPVEEKKKMTRVEIIQWMVDAYVMIGCKNDEGNDEGQCLLGALINKLKSENE